MIRFQSKYRSPESIALDFEERVRSGRDRSRLVFVAIPVGRWEAPLEFRLRLFHEEFTRRNPALRRWFTYQDLKNKKLGAVVWDTDRFPNLGFHSGLDLPIPTNMAQEDEGETRSGNGVGAQVRASISEKVVLSNPEHEAWKDSNVARSVSGSTFCIQHDKGMDRRWRPTSKDGRLRRNR